MGMGTKGEGKVKGEDMGEGEDMYSDAGNGEVKGRGRV